MLGKLTGGPDQRGDAVESENTKRVAVSVAVGSFPRATKSAL